MKPWAAAWEETDSLEYGSNIIVYKLYFRENLSFRCPSRSESEGKLEHIQSGYTAGAATPNMG